MPVVADFPVGYIRGDGTIVGTGPIINIFVEVPPEFTGDEQVYDDLGADYNEPAPVYVRRFRLLYNNKRKAEVAVLDAHWLAAHGRNFGFQFTHPQTGELISDVHYETYDRPDHTRQNEQERTIVLIKRPVGTT